MAQSSGWAMSVVPPLPRDGNESCNDNRSIPKGRCHSDGSGCFAVRAVGSDVDHCQVGVPIGPVVWNRASCLRRAAAEFSLNELEAFR
jgi:hypothetical protein